MACLTLKDRALGNITANSGGEDHHVGATTAKNVTCLLHDFVMEAVEVEGMVIFMTTHHLGRVGVRHQCTTSEVVDRGDRLLVPMSTIRVICPQ